MRTAKTSRLVLLGSGVAMLVVGLVGIASAHRCPRSIQEAPRAA
jgi:hypothetical protein